MKIKYLFNILLSMIIGTIKILLGGTDDMLITLLICMLIDMITGIICAFVFKKSTKTTTGAMSSTAMTKGICKKIGILFLVVIAYRIDVILGVGYICYTTKVFLVIEEILSIIENIGNMGVPIPTIIKKSLDVLERKISEYE